MGLLVLEIQQFLHKPQLLPYRAYPLSFFSRFTYHQLHCRPILCIPTFSNAFLYRRERRKSLLRYFTNSASETWNHRQSDPSRPTLCNLSLLALTPAITLHYLDTSKEKQTLVSSSFQHTPSPFARIRWFLAAAFMAAEI